MIFFYRFFTFSLLCLLLASAKPAGITGPPQTRDIVVKMISAIQQHRGCQFTMKSYERFKGQKNLIYNEFYMKVMVSPTKVYSKVLSEKNKGTELLYEKGVRDGKILVNAGKMLPNLKLSPYSSMLTKDQHHTMLSAGFSIISRLVGDAIKKADQQNRFQDVFRFAGEGTFQNRACWKITIDDPTYKLTTHGCQKGDNIYTVALRLLVPEYSMVELNDWVKNFETDLSGKQIQVPSAYAKKTVLWIDQETFFPLVQEVYDERGLFEKYEYYNLQINPKFAEDEFSDDFKEYNF